MHQKTWIDLLGTDATNCEVIGKTIVLYTHWEEIDVRSSKVWFKILWTFENHAEAIKAMHLWKNELAERNDLANAPTLKIMDPLENMEHEWASRNTPLPEYELGGEG